MLSKMDVRVDHCTSWRSGYWRHGIDRPAGKLITRIPTGTHLDPFRDFSEYLLRDLERIHYRLIRHDHRLDAHLGAPADASSIDIGRGDHITHRTGSAGMKTWVRTEGGIDDKRFTRQQETTNASHPMVPKRTHFLRSEPQRYR